MCGIAGVLYFDPSRPVDAGVLDRMTDVLAHRGPDGRGTHVDGSLGLGHRRLAIIDLSEKGAQPMANEDQTVWVVLNGEIYNFEALREELQGKGHTFRSSSDTEVLVHLYEEEGDRLVERLRGMFAFAIWDARRRRLVLGRDRFGQKPLYVRLTDESLHFASEIKGILADPEVEREPDPLALHGFLSHAYVPTPRTAFRGIEKLPPGHVLTVEGDGRREQRRYWQLHMGPKRGGSSAKALARAEEELLWLLDEATRLRMISDVPLGAFLSGGVDSSAVVASMCQSRASSVKTFAIGFEEQAYDESPFARQVAGHLGTEHTELILGADSFGQLERIVWHYGEPYADASALPTFAVSKLAREHVTVALTGDGGDELFVGYPRYQGVRLEERLRQIPAPLRGPTRSATLAGLVSRAGHADLANHLMHGRASHTQPLERFYLEFMRYVGDEQKQALYSDGFREATRGVDGMGRLLQALRASDGQSFAERCAHADASTYLPDDILVKVDVASMAFGLECRAPFLDHVLAEAVARLPFALKLRRLRTKAVLKGALHRRLPRKILERRKQGFGVPLEHWFKGQLTPLLRDVLLAKRSTERGYFRADEIERRIDEHARGVSDQRNLLFPLLMLELWHRVCVEAGPAASSAP